MNRLWFSLGMISWVAFPGNEDLPGVLPSIQLAPGPYYVGQGIALELRVPGLGAEPSVESPRLDDADLVPLETDPGAKLVGPEAKAWVSRFALVPHRAGELKVGPFRVRDATGRASSTKSSRLAIKAIPQAGRSARFLGGVGGCRVSAAVEPARVRQGQPVEFRIILEGPGAWGSVQAPDLAAWAGLSAGFAVQALGDRLDPGAAPSRTFRYRLRPARAGRVVLPPVAVTTFDPGSGRFETRATTGVPLVVEPPPRFDPATIELGPPARASPPGPVARIVVPAGATIIVGGMIAALLRRRRARTRTLRPVSWRREASRLRRWSAQERHGREVTVEVAERLTRGLARATDRPIAVLTPADAITAVEEVTGDPALAARVGALVARLDRARFDAEADANSTDADAAGLVGEAVDVFRRIGRSVRPSRPDRPTGPHPQGRDAG